MGLHRALQSILTAWDLLVEYTTDLRSKSYRPDRRKPKNSADEDRGETRVENNHDDSNDDEERHHEATFHQWGDEAWDLEVDAINDEDE